MKCSAVLVALSFVCLSSAMVGYMLGLVTLQVAVPLLHAAMVMLGVFFGIVILGWLPAHDMIQHIRQSASHFLDVDRLYVFNMLSCLSKIRSIAMKCGTVLLALSFVCLSSAMVGHMFGLVTLQVAVPLLHAAMVMLAVFIGIIMLGWVPAHDMIQRIRQSAWFFLVVDRLYFVDDDFTSYSVAGNTPPPRSTH